MFGIDCHTHSGNSPDGTGTVGGLCRRAISLGLEALAITEHVELNRWHSQGIMAQPHAMMKKNTAITNAWKKR